MLLIPLFVLRLAHWFLSQVMFFNRSALLIENFCSGCQGCFEPAQTKLICRILKYQEYSHQYSNLRFVEMPSNLIMIKRKNDVPPSPCPPTRESTPNLIFLRVYGFNLSSYIITVKLTLKSNTILKVGTGRQIYLWNVE